MIDFHAIAKALADPQRFEILEMVAAEVEMSCGDIAAGCPVSQATVSHHLKVLQDVGLLRVRRQGQRRNISADHEVLESYLRELSRRTSVGARPAKEPAA
ncbi:MAG: helix-turn-helix transcriptional regulator [Alphaproteobacteria bacterium]|nr:helix-turn-helix transcriptional regulator [Alphaproteobacteria bacterium]